MKYKKLGSSNLNVSEVCLGTMTFGEQNSEEESFAIMDFAVSRGVNFFDTAEAYPSPIRAETAGRTEEIIGSWLVNKPRDKIILATKVVGYQPNSHIPGNRKVPKSTEPQLARLDRANIEEAIEASLRRLRTDYVDLYQFHWPDRYVPFFHTGAFDISKVRKDMISFEEQVLAIKRLIDAGKVRYWGVCNETTYGICRLVEACDRLGVPRPVSVQNSYSLVNRRFEADLIEACYYYNIHLLPWSPLSRGALTGKYLENPQPEGARHTLFPDHMSQYFSDRVMEATKSYSDIAKRHHMKVSHLALAFCKSRWFIGSTIVGSTKISQLQDNFDAFDIELDENIIKEINDAYLKHGDAAQPFFMS
ncbi:hypothetical protein GAYE_SCF03G2383 [Galdieria yellowstonensis]|uniref:NADP-dependent oxidoreductase domain-containing protein n=1 Tax=Galdieria yellowstonensis TaxID=3028027 RepID=A0AAV9IAV1_9RHOD|nr:hypothetical protein GAYE_SCF03G2383 [Galdieria yellowstonensis]